METAEATKVEGSTGKTQCSGCGRFFSNVSAFDKHKIANWGRGLRRCKTDEEMRTLGMAVERKNVRITVEGKVHLDEHNVWFDEVGREKMREYWGNRAANDEE